MSKLIFEIKFLFLNFIHLSESYICHFRDEKKHMKLPLDIEDAKNLGLLLGRYKDLYYIQVLAGLFITYILYPFKNSILIIKSDFIFNCLQYTFYINNFFTNVYFLNISL